MLSLQRVLQSCALVTALAGPVSAQDLFPGEAIETAAGFPAITMYAPGQADRPLVIFVPGAHHTARVSYGGHEGAKDEDFLAYWLRQQGYNFLALSYPIDTTVGGIPTAHPDFTIRDWGRQIAELAAKHVAENGLNGEVIVMGWSMAGKVAQSVNEAMQEQGLDLQFYTSIAATAPLPGLIALTRELPMLDSGLADRRDNFAGWYAQVAANSEAVGHEIVPEQVFAQSYQGDIPVGIQGYSQVFRDGAFVTDQLAYQQDAKPFDYKNFPLVAMIIPDGRGDRRHALTDQAVWSVYNANTVFNSWITANGVDVDDLSDDDWRGMLDLTRSLDETLSVPVDGNHFFFMGEPGAKATAAALAELEQRVADVKSQASRHLGVTID